MNDNQAAANRLKQFIAEDRLIRHSWVAKDREGRETACLLASMVPAVEYAARTGAYGPYSERCPASVMPQWLAEATPGIDDFGTMSKWPAVVRRYADLAGRWHVLDDAAWKRAKVRAIEVARGLYRGAYGRGVPFSARLSGLLARIAEGEVMRNEKAFCDQAIDGVLNALELEITKAEVANVKVQDPLTNAAPAATMQKPIDTCGTKVLRSAACSGNGTGT